MKTGSADAFVTAAGRWLIGLGCGSIVLHAMYNGTLYVKKYNYIPSQSAADLKTEFEILKVRKSVQFV